MNGCRWKCRSQIRTATNSNYVDGEDPPMAVPPEYSHQPRFQFRPSRAGTFLLKVTAKDTNGASSTFDVQSAPRTARRSADG